MKTLAFESTLLHFTEQDFHQLLWSLGKRQLNMKQICWRLSDLCFHLWIEQRQKRASAIVFLCTTHLFILFLLNEFSKGTWANRNWTLDLLTIDFACLETEVSQLWQHLGSNENKGLQETQFTIKLCSFKKQSPLFQFSSFAQPWQTLCDTMNHSRPGLPVHHQLPESTQTHVHWVSDASNHLILCRPLLLLPSIFPNIRVFSNESALHIKRPKLFTSFF